METDMEMCRISTDVGEGGSGEKWRIYNTRYMILSEI